MHMVSGSRRRALLTLATIVVVSLSLFVGIIVAQDSANCPMGQGYWKNQPAVWPVTDLMLGSQMYTQLELIGILNLPPEGDASLILAHQLIAAKLNIAVGADATAVSGMIAQGDALLAALPNRLPFGIAPSSAEGATMTTLSGVLDTYNDGGLTVGCADDDDDDGESTPEVTPEATTEVTPEVTPEATLEVTPEVTPEVTVEPNGDVIIVIEGPVEQININIITIYNINIEVAPDDPLLTVIQIGDVIRVEGHLDDDDSDTIIIIAVTVIFIDIDVFVADDGQVWRDPGDCSNGPPPWAPAHGWRRRCEGGGGGGNDDDDDD
jgi:hypothetical protein